MRTARKSAADGAARQGELQTESAKRRVHDHTSTPNHTLSLTNYTQPSTPPTPPPHTPYPHNAPVHRFHRLGCRRRRHTGRRRRCEWYLAGGQWRGKGIAAESGDGHVAHRGRRSVSTHGPATWPPIPRPAHPTVACSWRIRLQRQRSARMRRWRRGTRGVTTVTQPLGQPRSRSVELAPPASAAAAVRRCALSRLHVQRLCLLALPLAARTQPLAGRMARHRQPVLCTGQCL